MLISKPRISLARHQAEDGAVWFGQRARLPYVRQAQTSTSWEGVLESWDDVVEGKGVGGQVHPSGVGGEETQCLSWPQTVVFVPHGDIRLSLAHVSGKIFNIQFP